MTDTNNGDAFMDAMRPAMEQVGARLGLSDPGDALWLLDWDHIEWQDETPTNLEELTQELIASKPYLLRGGDRSGLSDEDRAAAERMGIDPVRYAVLRDERYAQAASVAGLTQAQFAELKRLGDEAQQRGRGVTLEEWAAATGRTVDGRKR